MLNYLSISQVDSRIRWF